MALTFPRDMISQCRWKTPRLTLQHRQELSRTAAGAVQAKDLGPAMWVAEFRSVPLRLVDADAVIGDFGSLRGALHPMLLHDPARSRPASIASDAPLSGATVTVASVGAGNDTLAFSGLPSEFVLSAGDRLTATTAGGFLAHFRLLRGGTADVYGDSAALEVEPSVPVGVAAGDTVTLIRPPVQMRLIPDTLDDPYVSQSHREIVFQAQQDYLA